MQRDDHAHDRQRERDHRVNAAIVELGVKRRIDAHHRQRDLLIAQPLEHVEHGERIGEHRECEVVAAQAKRRQADDDAGEHADDDSERDPEPGRDAEFHERDRHRIAAEPEEHSLPERDHAAVAAQHVPGEPHDRP